MLRIQFDDIRIHSISSSSGIFIGSNVKRLSNHVMKQNQAFGTINGKSCRLSDFRSSLDDRDQLDFHFGRKPHHKL